MSSYGVVATGFAKKPLDTIKEEIEQALRAELGDALNLLATSVFGNLVGILADREHEIWELLEDVYASQYPSGATGQSADNVASYTGVPRLEATKSTVALTANLNAGVTLPAGRIVSQGAGSDVRFVTTAAVTNSGGSPADVPVAAEADGAGPIVALAGTLTHIETPVTGWNSVTNAADADVGRDQETDTALLDRREALLRADGKASLDAIVAAVREVTGVTTAHGFQNVMDTTDGDGVPPHGVEILALGGDDQDIFDAIFGSVGGGIRTHGTESGTSEDINGTSQPVAFSRPTEVPIHAIVELTKDSNYPADGDTQVKAALASAGDSLGVGTDVITTALYEHVFSITGVVDVTKLWVGTSDPPTGAANISIDSRELSTWDTSDIDVTST